MSQSASSGKMKRKENVDQNFESSKEPNKFEASVSGRVRGLNVYNSPDQRPRRPDSKERRLIGGQNTLARKMVESHCKGLKLLWKKGTKHLTSEI